MSKPNPQDIELVQTCVSQHGGALRSALHRPCAKLFCEAGLLNWQVCTRRAQGEQRYSVLANIFWIHAICICVDLESWFSLITSPASCNTDFSALQVLRAVSTSGLALEHASQKLRDDEEVVIRAVQCAGLALEFASTRCGSSPAVPFGPC